MTVELAKRTPEKPLNVLSLGAGIQSTYVLLRYQDDLDYAVFADTGWEPQSVYDALEQLKAISKVPVIVIKHNDLREASWGATLGDGKAKHELPLFVLNSGKAGMIRRQCTKDYKIMPIRKEIRRLAGYKPRQRIPAKTVRLWMGISADEAVRMKPSDAIWLEHIYPLCDTPIGTGEITKRKDCVRWLNENYPDVRVGRSACVTCPYHTNAEWREMKDNDPESWAEAVAYDAKIRGATKDDGRLFVHRSCKPLEEVDLSTPEDHGQMNFFDEECTGMCGL